MPEGDTIHHAANQIRPVLAGRVPEEIATPHPRFGKRPLARAPRRAGREAWTRTASTCSSLRGDLVIHSHLRMTGWWGVTPRAALAPLAAARVARVPRAGPRGRAVRRPGARADDRRRARVRPRIAGLGPGRPRRRVRRRALPAAAARGRPDAADRRRAARPAHRRRARNHVARGGLFRGARSTRGGRPAKVGDDQALARARAPPGDAAVRARRCNDTRATPSTAKRGALSPLRRADPRARAVGEQPPDILVPGMPDDTRAKRIGHKGADLIAPGQHARELRRRARGRRRHGRVRRAPRAPRRLRRARAGPRLRRRRARGGDHARGGARPLRQDAGPASSSTST